MCERCQIAAERQRLTELAMENPTPCVVCSDKNVVGVGTWLPDDRHYLAAGGTKTHAPLFAFCLCEIHASFSEEMQKLVTQAILREVRLGRKFRR